MPGPVVPGLDRAGRVGESALVAFLGANPGEDLPRDALLDPAAETAASDPSIAEAANRRDGSISGIAAVGGFACESARAVPGRKPQRRGACSPPVFERAPSRPADPTPGAALMAPPVSTWDDRSDLSYRAERAPRSKTAAEWFPTKDTTWPARQAALLPLGLDRPRALAALCPVWSALGGPYSAADYREPRQRAPRLLGIPAYCGVARRMPFLRTKSATVADPPAGEMPVAVGYCGVDSAELGRVWAGDLGRSEATGATARHPAAPGPATHLVSGRKSDLHVPLGVLA